MAKPSAYLRQVQQVPETMQVVSEPPTTFVLDTNVLRFNPNSIFDYGQRAVDRVFLASPVVRELDEGKKGRSKDASQIRAVNRLVASIVIGKNAGNGVSLAEASDGKALGSLVVSKQLANLSASATSDEQTCWIANDLVAKEKRLNRRVVLVTNDNNMVAKASPYGLLVELFTPNKIEHERDERVRSGFYDLPQDFWALNDGTMIERDMKGLKVHEVDLLPGILLNTVVHGLWSDRKIESTVTEIRSHAGRMILRQNINYRVRLHSVSGLLALNPEQNAQMNHCMDPNMDLVFVVGPAGCGKSLLAVACGLHQRYMDERYDRIVFMRADGESEIGFLTGDEREKILPTVLALQDNLGVIERLLPHQRLWSGPKTVEELLAAIDLPDAGFADGRSLQKTYLVLDEAHKWPLNRLLMLLSRAGPDTKVIVCAQVGLGNNLSDLRRIIEAFAGLEHAAIVRLTDSSPRSWIAAQVNRLFPGDF